MKLFKDIKGVVVILLLLATSLALCSCMYLNYDFKDIPEENIELIQFYDISGAEWRDSDAVKAEEPFYTVPQDRQTEFLDRLREIEFQDVVPMFMPTDPSFSYGFYVACISLEDGSKKLISDGGYNQMFDENGKCVDSDHFYCDNEEWLELIYDFAGERSSRVIYNTSTFIIPVNEHLRIHEILSSAKECEKNENCRFSSDDYIEFEGKKYYLSENNQPIFKLDDKYYRITEQDREELYRIIIKNISFWRYGELNETAEG